MIGINMEMPDSCEGCRFISNFISPAGNVYKSCRVNNLALSLTEVKASTCPLVEIEIEHSRWIKDGDEAKCEKCGREAAYQIVDNHWAYENFCPHCGSRMNNKEQNHESNSNHS